jgi:ADP-heptose:LPS heptosyltransferase
LRHASVDVSTADRQRERFFTASRAYSYDLAIQMHGGGAQSNPFVRRLGATLSVGLSGPSVERLDVNVPYVFYQHEVARYIELVSALGVPSTGLKMDAPEVSSDRDELRLAWPSYDKTEYAIVHVGASDARRRWPIERFAAVADILSREHDLTIVATGSTDDRILVQQLLQTATSPILDLSGRTTLGAVGSLVRRARVVVSNDTGLSNLAIAVDTPSVIVYWCGNVITAGPFNRSRHRPVLSWTIDCPGCGLRQCNCRVSFVADATLEEVLSQTEDLLCDGSDGAATTLLQ